MGTDFTTCSLCPQRLPDFWYFQCHTIFPRFRSSCYLIRDNLPRTPSSSTTTRSPCKHLISRLHSADKEFIVIKADLRRKQKDIYDQKIRFLTISHDKLVYIRKEPLSIYQVVPHISLDILMAHIWSQGILTKGPICSFLSTFLLAKHCSTQLTLGKLW